MPSTRSQEYEPDVLAQWQHAVECTEHRQKKLGQDAGALAEEPLVPWSEPACQVDGADLYRFTKLVSIVHLNPENSFHVQIKLSLMEAGRLIARLRPEDLEAERDHQQRFREAAAERDRDILDARFELQQVLSDVGAQRKQLGRLASNRMSGSAVRAAEARLDRVAQRAGEALDRLGNNSNRET